MGTRNKYGVAAKPDRTFDGIVFDSKAEMAHYIFLRGLLRAGEIVELDRQPSFELIPKPNRIVYKPDFRILWKNGREEFWDVKGARTPAFNLKEKMFRHFNPDKTLVVGYNLIAVVQSRHL